VLDALDWFAQQQVDTVTVVTQGRNIAAQALYQRRGFITQSQQLWYHKWFRRPEPEHSVEG
jgi:ribosomal protein S18 acetylase RimI-like enzyme